MSRLKSLIIDINAAHVSYQQDVRELYGRAQKYGYDKTAVGQVALILRRHADDIETFSKSSALVQEYLTEIGFVSTAASPACARESNTAGDRPLTIKERARGIVDFAAAQKRGEIPADAEVPARLRGVR